jgi:hypothetical protein
MLIALSDLEIFTSRMPHQLNQLTVCTDKQIQPQIYLIILPCTSVAMKRKGVNSNDVGTF